MNNVKNTAVVSVLGKDRVGIIADSKSDHYAAHDHRSILIQPSLICFVQKFIQLALFDKIIAASKENPPSFNFPKKNTLDSNSS